MIHALVLATLVGMTPADQANLVEMTATIPPAPLVAGRESAIDVEMRVADGWSASG